MKPSQNIYRLLEIMASLRTPETGCPWDLQQTFETISPYTIEEAYEVADAIERGSSKDLCEELGDLLLQVVFHARLAEEEEQFTFGDVVYGITEKLIRRHPHVFNKVGSISSEQVKQLWQDIKDAEKKARQLQNGTSQDASESLLEGVPKNMPSLMRAEKLQKKAARVGFDWTETSDVIAKVHEELAELEEAVTLYKAKSIDKSAISEEIGDLLFSIANLARHLDIDPEMAVRSTNEKFSYRFKYIEQHICRYGKTMEDANLSEMEALWQEAKITKKKPL